jgi:hypothetical protein
VAHQLQVERQLVEAGVRRSSGQFAALSGDEKLLFSMPDAMPIAINAGNCSIQLVSRPD